MMLYVFFGTLPETNIFAPENRPSQREFHLSTSNFSGAKMLVSGRVTVSPASNFKDFSSILGPNDMFLLFHGGTVNVEIAGHRGW